MKRRDFIKSVIAGSTVGWPLAAWAQQPTVIGFLRSTKAEESGHLIAAVREGLRDSGYPGDKVLIESRWGNIRDGQLSKLARELIALSPAAIVAGGFEVAQATKAATASIPIIFVTGADPLKEGLVSSINRPGGNMTGVSFYDVPVTGKRLALLLEFGQDCSKSRCLRTMSQSSMGSHQSVEHQGILGRERERLVEAVECCIRLLRREIKVSEREEIFWTFSRVQRDGLLQRSFRIRILLLFKEQ